MTNTRITDPEIIESRYPVRLRAFAVRRGSGGSGRYRGGDGVIRHFTFLGELDVAIVSQRRAVPPFGLNGGGPGKTGENIRVRADGAEEMLEGNASYHADAGEELIIRTPGGGDWGAESAE